MERVSSHTFLIAQYFAQRLGGLRHGNGAALAEIYCHDGFRDRATQGAIVNFSLKRADGQYIGFAQVGSVARSRPGFFWFFFFGGVGVGGGCVCLCVVWRVCVCV